MFYAETLLSQGYTRQEMIEELQAYVRNEHEVFDFGEGEMQMETFEGSYYAFEISLLDRSFYERQFDSWWIPERKEKEIPDTIKPIKRNRYSINRRFKNKHKKLAELGYINHMSSYYEKESNNRTYIKNCYRGKRSMYLKKQSHRIVRRNKEYFPKGNKSNRLFGFWWELY